MSNTENQKSDVTSKVMRYGMMACCTVMLLPVAGFFIAGGSIAGLWSNIAVLAPIVLCIGAHAVMFKMMGKSCHSSNKENVADVDVVSQPSRIPVIERV